MIDIDNLTKEQEKKFKKFVNFYKGSRINLYSRFYHSMLEDVINTPYYNSYQNIINRTGAVIKEMGYTDSLSASIVFEYLLWNGYLSKDKKLSFNLSDRVNNLVIPGADIMRGKTVCLNNADMLAKVLTSIGNEAYMIGCYVDPSTSTLKNSSFVVPNIKRTIDDNKESIFIKLLNFALAKRISNHAVTLIRMNDAYLLADPTNLAFAKFIDVLKGRYIGTRIKIDIKPWMLLFLNDFPRQDFINTIFDTYLNSDIKTIGPKGLNNLNDKIIKSCDDNKDYLEQFYNSILEDIDIVCSTLEKLKVENKDVDHEFRFVI